MKVNGQTIITVKANESRKAAREAAGLAQVMWVEKADFWLHPDTVEALKAAGVDVDAIAAFGCEF